MNSALSHFCSAHKINPMPIKSVCEISIQKLHFGVFFFHVLFFFSFSNVEFGIFLKMSEFQNDIKNESIEIIN